MSKVSLSDVVSDRNWMPVEITADACISFRKLGEKTLKDSSFLDNRIKGASDTILKIKIKEILSFIAETGVSSSPLGNVFHISHVGSTYIAKLCDGFNGTRVYREPTIYRQLQHHYTESKKGNGTFSLQDIRTIHKLLNRLFSRGPDISIIKHTSRNLLLPNIRTKVDLPDLLIYTSLQNFLAHGVSSGGTQSDAMTVGSRIEFLNNLTSERTLSFDKLNLYQRIALVWMNEVSKVVSRAHYTGNIMLNFDKVQAEQGNMAILEILQNWLEPTIGQQNLEDYDMSVFNVDSKSQKAFDYKVRSAKIESNLNKDAVRDTLSWSENLINKNIMLAPLIDYI